MMRLLFLYSLLFLSSSVMGQSLRDSLFGGKLKMDTNKIAVSKDTGKYIPPKVYNASVQADAKKGEVNKLDEPTMPDSLNKTFYAKQKTWKRFIEINTGIITQQADDTKKVKKGEYIIDIDYEIGLNGKVKANEIVCNPHNEFLIEQVTELMKRVPTLAPPVYSDGKPKPLLAKQYITITKK